MLFLHDTYTYNIFTGAYIYIYEFVYKYKNFIYHNMRGGRN